MKARGGRFLLILGAGLAAMAFVVVYLVMSKNSAAVDNAAAVPVQVVMKSIVVAKKNIPAYTTLDESNLGLLPVDASTVSADAVTDPSTLYKKMTTAALSAQKPILASQVTSVSFSNSLAKGERAYSLPVNARNTFADSISENDRVDVMWTVGLKVSVPYRTADGKIELVKDVFTTTKTLLQDVKVLRVVSLQASLPPPAVSTTEGDAQKTAATNAQIQSTLSGMYASNGPYSTVLILAVNDQAAEVLKYAQENGNGIIDLVLRSSAAVRDTTGVPIKDASGAEMRGDHDVEKTTGVTIDMLIKSYGLVPPPAGWQAAPTP